MRILKIAGLASLITPMLIAIANAAVGHVTIVTQIASTIAS